MNRKAFRATQGAVVPGFTIGVNAYGGQLAMDLGSDLNPDGTLDVCEVYLDVDLATRLRDQLSHAIAIVSEQDPMPVPGVAPRGFGWCKDED